MNRPRRFVTKQLELLLPNVFFLLILYPPLDRIKMLDFSKLEVVEKLGYDHALPILADFKAKFDLNEPSP